jgi:hypothetical protein
MAIEWWLPFVVTRVDSKMLIMQRVCETRNEKSPSSTNYMYEHHRVTKTLPKRHHVFGNSPRTKTVEANPKIAITEGRTYSLQPAACSMQARW